MYRSRDEHYIDEWEGVVSVRSIYGGTVKVCDSHAEAEQWIAQQRAYFDRDARASHGVTALHGQPSRPNPSEADQ